MNNENNNNNIDNNENAEIKKVIEIVEESNKNYDAESIQVFENIGAVRKRPYVY